MKKLGGSLVLLILGLAGFFVVEANSGKFDRVEDVMYVDVISNGWSLFPFMGSAWADPISSDSLTQEVRTRFSLSAEDDFKLEDIHVAFVFDSVKRKYIQIAGKGTDNEVLRSIDYDDVSRYPAIWVYAKNLTGEKNVKKALFKLNKERMPSVDDFTMKKGWNFIWVTPDLVGRTIDDIGGSCLISKMASWDNWPPENGIWKVTPFSDIPRDKIESKAVGNGFLVQVSGDCKMGTK